MKNAEITWSLMHPTPLDPEYMHQLIAKSKEYRVDSFEICAQCHTPYGGLDGLINYREYPHAFANWDQEKVADTQQRMNEVLRIAHAAGKPVYYWHREVMVPPGLIEDIPELLDENGEFNLLGEAFADLIRYKIDRAFAAAPELDGLVLSLTEADFSAIHNSNTRKYPPVEVVSFIISIFASELEKRNKRFIMRSFGSIAQDYEDILAGAEKLAGKHKFEIETKITPYDFDPFLPKNPFLRSSANFTLSAECEVVGEFMGQGNMPFEHVHNLVRYVREGQEAGVDRFVIRMDRRGNCIFDIYEINYYAYSRALENPDITADEIRQEWYDKHYPAAVRDAYIELDKIGWEMVCKTYFIDKQVLFHGNYAMKYIKAGFIFALFRDGATLENGKDIWSILTDRPAPGRAAILQEKDEAVACADRGLEICRSINMTDDDFRLRLWQNAVVVTRCVRELVRCIAAYFDEMDNSGDGTLLKQQVAASLAEFDRLAGHKVEIQKREVINGLEHRLKEYRRSIEEICIEPLAAICQALPEEFAAECAARKKFFTDCVDGIILGGIYDDYRMYRYMHGSHSVLRNGLPGRWAGNRVFPNGFIEVTVKRGDDLYIYGDISETREFVVCIDGDHRIYARFNDEGCWKLPVGADTETMTLRLEKSGSEYPMFYAVVTRKNPELATFSYSICEDELDETTVPEPVFDEKTEWLDLYYEAWQEAYDHIFHCPVAPVKTYMNEGIRIHKIWIWDTCFMVQFCRYAASVFPGLQSLDNFYKLMHDGEKSVIKIHIPDNPPLFAWTEYEYFKHTGDVARVKEILLEKRYLQKHFEWLYTVNPGELYDYSDSPTAAKFVPGKGFLWGCGRAGMDNSPRGEDDQRSIYFVDLSAQQGLSALYIAKLAEAIGEKALADEYYGKFEELKKFVNERFWSDSDRMYFDRKVDESGFSKVLTPASMWPMLAEICSDEQSKDLAAALADPNRLGGERVVPSVSRDDNRYFDPTGGYWRGGIWMPKVYMTVKGLEKYGHWKLADEIAEKIIRQQYNTWRNFEPHTIWECYSPTEDKPSTDKKGRYARQEFCGWSALGPISLFIENILGIREVNALKNRIVWTPRRTQRNGIKNLKMGGKNFSLIAYPDRNEAEISAEQQFTLCLNGKEISLPAGKSIVKLD
ncbi:MAG: hypothetical protein IJW35_08360 [Lentisphaeria bacterium]|nr:hypothetical protein [Lentisphaeria bacterium]